MPTSTKPQAGKLGYTYVVSQVSSVIVMIGERGARVTLGARVTPSIK